MLPFQLALSASGTHGVSDSLSDTHAAIDISDAPYVLDPSDDPTPTTVFDVVDALDQYTDTVYRLAYARTGSHADSEDVLQEVFLRLLRTKPAFQGEEHRKAWLLRVTLQCAASVHRSAFRRRTIVLESDLPDRETSDFNTPLEVLDAVSRLPVKYRTVIHLFYYEDCTVAQIAALIDAAENTVKSRLHRARNLLRGTLKGDLFHE